MKVNEFSIEVTVTTERPHRYRSDNFIKAINAANKMVNREHSGAYFADGYTTVVQYSISDIQTI